MSSDLYMHKISLDTGGLISLAKRRRLLGRESTDLGYIVHCALGELFGENAPKPFALVNANEDPADPRQPGTLRVLGYARSSWEKLDAHAKMFADPEIFGVCRFDECAGKPMPTSWSPGMKLGFEVRTCPVARGAKIDGTEIKGEVDAYVNARRRAQGDHVEREVVYRRWLENQLQVHGGATIVEARVSRFFLRTLTRRTHGRTRKAHRSRRPDATLSGTLEVTDDSKFKELLARGVGRHRAFGFGMLLLRPPQSR